MLVGLGFAIDVIELEQPEACTKPEDCEELASITNPDAEDDDDDEEEDVEDVEEDEDDEDDVEWRCSKSLGALIDLFAIFKQISVSVCLAVSFSCSSLAVVS